MLLRPLGGSLISWDAFADTLAERARVVVFDARGTGESGNAPLTTTTRSMARDARALLDHLGISRASVYGISLGGMVATWLAVDAPARVDRLVLASTLPRGTEIRSTAILRGISLARCLARSPREAEAGMVARILSSRFRQKFPDEVRRMQDLARARPSSHRNLLVLLGAAARHDARQHLHEITAKTLVLIGELDPLLTVDSQKELVEGIPGAMVEVSPGVGHDISAEAPRDVAQRVLSFALG